MWHYNKLILILILILIKTILLQFGINVFIERSFSNYFSYILFLSVCGIFSYILF